MSSTTATSASSSSSNNGNSSSNGQRPAAIFTPLLSGKLPSQDDIDIWVQQHRTVVTAGTASLVSTIASFPFDSVKSRLQVKYYPSIWACGRAVLEEEGLAGFFRGVTIPLITITFVRTSSFSIYYNTKSALHTRGYAADSSKLSHIALSGLAGGFTSGVIISCGSAPFELVKVQRQLEYLIATQKGAAKKNAQQRESAARSRTAPASGGDASRSYSTSARTATRLPPQLPLHPPASLLASYQSHPSRTFASSSLLSAAASSSSSSTTTTTTRYVPQSGFQAAREIMTNHGGIRGFYLGFRLHFLRDTSGTALYFGLYDTLREMVRRHTGEKAADVGGSSSRRIGNDSSANTGPPPRIFGMPTPPMPVLQFLTGSTAGILSWLAVYWIDFLKTNVQQRRLAEADSRITAWQVLNENPDQSVLQRITRLYRGIGISAVRSFISHGLTWTLIEQISERIDARERLRSGDGSASSSSASSSPSHLANDTSSSPDAPPSSATSRWR
ncbi:unnamed protein product [Tilletia caries]|uniref:Mitochondrial carrier n=2 Tax=Tilletia TaxID=13289 RepID=A0A8X7SX22_9BASI|nr:hypothetical protein CF328_g5052 [Tilletia controversa]KAE8195248.1 hypothetical protein CF336_g3173 [Tilletia laevis]KAE8257324.1 hypothetical protein A4X03_0g4709 [Tilletia caries]KAE8195882.1 hypothetical protein CF335_g4988 [Tilletia laevis]KAE8248285.1 hypothetical protein A4X06_0g3822 [Tilletia controversa]